MHRNRQGIDAVYNNDGLFPGRRWRNIIKVFVTMEKTANGRNVFYAPNEK